MTVKTVRDQSGEKYYATAELPKGAREKVAQREPVKGMRSK